MTWRSVQLGDALCDQDKLILDLFQDKSVRYVGQDHEFAKNLQCDVAAKNMILTINHAVWVSDLLDSCQQHLTADIDQAYLSVNRYCLLGNDTDFIANNVIDLLAKILTQFGFTAIQTGQIERDLGRYFNFVQPLTWAYGSKTAN
jgi:hypothetical protein